MDFVRMSVQPPTIDLPDRANTPPPDVSKNTTQVEGVDCATIFASCTNKCLQVLPLLAEEKNFASKYWTLPIGIPDCYVFSHRSTRCIVLEVVTRFPESQLENLHTYKFISHPFFEDTIKKYSRCKETPNPNLIRTRTWDVAVNLVMKVEALPNPFDRFFYLLYREYRVLKHLWHKYLESNMDIDEMTGIPMVFEYVEIPNDVFFAVAEGHQVTQIDVHGKMKPLTFETGTSKRSTLAYMTMEKLGPSLAYLQLLMRSTNRQPLTFDLWTALKIFDQILCRIMQMHRFSVVHNDVSPENVFMGNGVAFDVVYLNSFKRAYVVDSDDKDGPGGLAASCIGCNIRFASAAQLSGSARPMHPADDVESAFYILLAMFNANCLPWDSLLKVRRHQTSPASMVTSKSNVGWNNAGHESGNNRIAYDDQTMQVGPMKISTDTIRKVYEMKQRFWSANNILNNVTTNATCTFMCDEFQSATVSTVIREVYFRIRSWRLNIKGCIEAPQHCKKMNNTTSEEYRIFNELRKSALLYFKFAETFELLNDLPFRKKVATQLQKEDLQQQPWNALLWCFNNIEIKPDGKFAGQPAPMPDNQTVLSSSITSNNAF